MLIGLLSLVPLRLLITHAHFPRPQAILVLEGRTERIYFAAQFAQLRLPMPIWISGNPAGEARNRNILKAAGVLPKHIFYDACAVDTVTNFTCTVGALRQNNIHHVYLITSDYHMVRSLAIATIVYGSRGIAVTPVTVTTSDRPPESLWRVLRDCMRSIMWLVTGRTGAILHRVM